MQGLKKKVYKKSFLFLRIFFLPLDKHSGSLEPRVWRCLVVESVEEYKISLHNATDWGQFHQFWFCARRWLFLSDFLAIACWSAQHTLMLMKLHWNPELKKPPKNIRWFKFRINYVLLLGSTALTASSRPHITVTRSFWYHFSFSFPNITTHTPKITRFFQH